MTKKKGLPSIASIARQIAKKKRSVDEESGKKYDIGDEDDLVWINFQVTKGMKRELDNLRRSNSNLNLSEVVRRFLRKFIDSGGIF